MKLVDANVVLYSVNADPPHHESSRAWLDDALSGKATVGFAWIALLAFLRLSTKVGLLPQPLPVGAALAQVNAWTSQASAMVLEPSARHLDVLAELLAKIGTGGNVVSGAHLAALAVEHRATVVTFDHDFGRFAGVRWEQPGASR